MLFLKGMSEEQQINIYKDLYYTSYAINSGKKFLKDLKPLEMSEALTDHVSSEINSFESIIKSNLFYIDDKDRINIMKHAFNSLSAIKSQISLEGDSSYYDEQYQALQTLITLNNQTMFVKYGIQTAFQQQESLSSLPQDQLESFSSFLSNRMANTQSQAENPDSFGYMNLESLYNTSVQILNEPQTTQQ